MDLIYFFEISTFLSVALKICFQEEKVFDFQMKLLKNRIF